MPDTSTATRTAAGPVSADPARPETPAPPAARVGSR